MGFRSTRFRSALALAGALTAAAANARDARAQSVPGQPLGSFWQSDPNTSNCILNWDPASDPDAAFNRATVPLASRVAAANVNSNARAGQGGVTSLAAFSNFGNSQGAASQQVYVPTFWQYMDKLVYWGGAAGSGTILAPNATVIDAAHRNGVRALGNVFLAPNVYGGTMTEVNAFLTQRPDGSYPVADKMIQAAQYYGFDGWFLNQETSGGNSTTAVKMQGFINYMHAKAPSLHVQWYDSMNESGGIGWQGALNSNNDAYFDTTASPSTGKVSDSMFIDFRWNGNSANLTNSATVANNLGRSQYELYAGVDFESRRYSIANDVDTIFTGAGGNHRTSLGIYRPEYTFVDSNKSNVQDFYSRDEILWVGQNHNPANTTTTNAWKGIANYVAARSSARGATFATNFSIGTGTAYRIDGQQLASGAWNNLSLQDVQPTYRWVVNSATANKLTPSFSHTDAWYGGTSLLIGGTLDGANDVKLYQTEIPVAADTKLKLVFKPDRANPLMKVAVAFADAPDTYVYFDVGAAHTANAWNTKVLDIGGIGHGGRTISQIALRFGDGVTTPITGYDTRLGQLVVYRGTQSTPAAPAAPFIDSPAAVGKSGATSNSLPLRLHWTQSTDAAYAYNVYRRNPDNTLQFLGATPNNAYFVPAVTRVGAESFVTLEFETVGNDFGVTPAASRSKLSFYVDWPRAAQTLDWKGGAGTWNDTALDWNGGPTAPTNQFWSSLQKDTPRFGGAAGGTVDVALPVTVGGMSFTTPGYRLQGSAITLGASTSSVDVSSAAQSAEVRNAFAGTGRLVKLGAGALTLSGNNTHAGGVTLGNGVSPAGRLNINSPTALGTGSVIIQNNSAATLDNTTGAPLTLSTNNAHTWSGDFTFAGTDDLNLGTGSVIMSASRRITVLDHALTVAGGILASPGIGLAKSGPGALVLSGPNTYTGQTALEDGTMRMGANNVFSDNSPLSLTGGVFDTNGHADKLLRLTFAGAPIIRFGGAGDVGNRLTFIDAAASTGTLSLINWDGLVAGNGADQFVFLDVADAELIAGGIVFINPAGLPPGTYAANVVDAGGGRTEIVPVPEPAAAGAFMSLVLLAGVTRRGRARHRHRRSSPALSANPPSPDFTSPSLKLPSPAWRSVS